ncbi:hypothetical protein H5154_19155 [Pseudoalteromonas sp. SR44-5]|uniref:hypothetical protein n=1 Tax=unclassified Pseudoalteromonas TaxID=194690 RepID=UPI0015FF0FBD|nr:MULTISPECIES: hypothetical protein [unclassified Pseudoalteromonas]MBB1335420.1 hypothetical protein [Pseudoalteromonas sp. SR41-6]MBB1368486.1 hypothetical protein [Pseudoalteromonas sp. SR44-5]MBB1460923.1 hypothetical protein [Pseudoalteromonas sp. SG41-8]MBB1478857.1 hypothetical protein [Pseudoalteromonas sp. SG41-2]
MYISPYTALDAAIAASEKPVTDKIGCDERATVIDLLSQTNQQNQALKHETDQIFILGYN